jgi:hypothetical protein
MPLVLLKITRDSPIEEAFEILEAAGALSVMAVGPGELGWSRKFHGTLKTLLLAIVIFRGSKSLFQNLLALIFIMKLHRF